jgi:DNA-binding TFAR19-related protein (PDSD5 family)
MTTISNTQENEEAIFDCITQEADRQRLKHPEHVDAISAAEKKTKSLVKEGKITENLMLVEFKRTLEKLWAQRRPSGNN